MASTEKAERLKTLDTDKLLDVVRNYRQYGYNEDLRIAAIALLKERGVDEEHLKLTGNFENRTFDFALVIYASFQRNSRVAFVLYGLLIVAKLLPLVAMDSEMLTGAARFIELGSLILYVVFLLLSFINQTQFYRVIGKKYGSDGALMYLFFGMPLYVIMYFYFRNQMRQQMKMIR